MDYKLLAANFLTSYAACYLATHVKINFNFDINFSWAKNAEITKEESTSQQLDSIPIVNTIGPRLIKNNKGGLIIVNGDFVPLDDNKTEKTADPAEIVGYTDNDDYASVDDAFTGLDIFSKDLREEEEKRISESKENLKGMNEDVFNKLIGTFVKERDTGISQPETQEMREKKLEKQMEEYMKIRDVEVPKAVPREIVPCVN